MGETVILDADDVEAIARRVAELLGQVPGPVDAHSVAAELQVERDWVYAHARDLGVVRLGDGPKARLRFDLEQVRERVIALATTEQEPPPKKPRSRSRRAGEPAMAGVKLIAGRSSR
jgi:hypothetical protein